MPSEIAKNLRINALIPFTPIIGVVCWWFLVLPGLYSADSGDSLRQVVSGSWNNWQTTGFIASVWLFSFGGYFVSLPAFISGLILAITVGYLYRAFLPSETSNLKKISGGVVLGILPQVGVFGFTLWKDVLFTVGCLWFLILQVENKSNKKYLYLFLACTVIASFRWNGFLVLLIFEVLNFLKNRQINLKRWLTILGAIVFGISTLLVPPALGIIDGVDSRFFNSPRLHDIAVVYERHPQIFSDEDLQLLAVVAPKEDWKIAGSQCLTHDNLMFTLFPKNAPNSYINYGKNSKNFANLWEKVVREEPVEVLTTRICRARSSWDPTLLFRPPQIIPVDVSPEAADYGVKVDLDKSAFRSYLINYVTKPPFNFFWSAPFLLCAYWSYLLIRLPGGIRRGKRKNISTALILAYSILLSTALTQVAQDLRYNFSVVIIVITLFTTTIVGRTRKI